MRDFSIRLGVLLDRPVPGWLWRLVLALLAGVFVLEAIMAFWPQH